MRSCWPRVGPKSNDSVLVKAGKGQIETQMRRPGYNGGRSESRYQKPRIARMTRGGRGKEGSSSRAFGGMWPLEI